jgi:2-polyprenyl-6-hydroxyphenyl methylase/3-demethylubiquinone-9 3-methyltransferase
VSHVYDEVDLCGDKSNPGYTYAYENCFKFALNLVTKAASPPANILDLAAAQGNFTLFLAELGYRVVRNDLRAELEEYVRQKYELGHVEYRAGDVSAVYLNHEPLDC